MKQKEEYYKSVIDANKDRIFRICKYYATRDEDAKDLCQEVLINIWKSIDKFQKKSKISTWIYRIAVNTSLTYVGKLSKNINLSFGDDICKLKNIIGDNNDDYEEKESDFAELQILLNQLSIIDNVLISLVLEGLTTKEISEIIGISEVNVRVKICRIKQDLRNKMKGNRNEYK